MPERLFGQIRTGAAEVVRRARFVRLDEPRVASFAAELENLGPAEGIDDPAQQPFPCAETTAAFVLTLAAVNFGSGYFPHLRKRPGGSGYFTISRALRERFDAEGPFAAGELMALTPAECAELFGQQSEVQNPQSAIAELMGLFARALHDLGRFLLARGQASVGRANLHAERGEGKSRTSPFLSVVEAAGHSAERLVGLLAEMPFFRDVSAYDGLAVPFYKRAQLAAADLARALAGQPLGRFDDLAGLTLFADNLVPHVLRVEGVLRYEPGLLGRIEREELIPAGSPEEVEIRASAVDAVERLVAALRERGRPATAHDLDWVLWSRGQLPRYKGLPRHRTRTVFY